MQSESERNGEEEAMKACSYGAAASTSHIAYALSPIVPARQFGRSQRLYSVFPEHPAAAAA
jgi:hypothetical protein